MNTISENITTEDKETQYFKLIGKRIRHMRKKHNISQEELGRLIGYGGSAISNYEIAYSPIPLTVIKRIADVFGVNVSYFTEVSDNDKLLKMYEHLGQMGVIMQHISYYNPDNTNGILLNDVKLSDGYVHLPKKSSSDDVICTEIADNSMARMGFKKGEYIFVNTAARPSSGQVALIYDTAAKKFLLRKYMIDGPMVTLLAEGYEEIPPIYTDINDAEYTLVGPIIRWTQNQ